MGTVAKSWMKGASAPLRGALLGLVLERPGGRGELTGRLQERFGESFKVERRDVYRLLEGLEREGLIDSREADAGAGQLVYLASARTSRALGDWISSAPDWEAPRRDIEAKLVVASEEDAPALCRALRRHEMECLALSHALPTVEADPASVEALLRDCARDGMLARLQANIEWARSARRRIEDFAGQQAAR